MISRPDETPTPIVVIKESAAENWRELLDKIIEGLTGKYDYLGYRNHVSANLRIIGALQTTLLLSLLFFCFTLPSFFILPESIVSYLTPSNFAAFFLTFAGICGGIFWKEKSSIHGKWQYLAGLYNELMKTPHPSANDSYPKRELLRVALAMDILKMDMWSHESFADVFRDCLETAIRNCSSPTVAADVIIGKLDSKAGISRRMANAYLSEYQSTLLEAGSKAAA